VNFKFTIAKRAIEKSPARQKTESGRDTAKPATTGGCAEDAHTDRHFGKKLKKTCKTQQLQRF